MSRPAAPARPPSPGGDAKPRVVIVMPAYNAARTLEDTFRAIPSGYFDEIVVVVDTRCDAGTTPLDPHLHRRHVESLYVLAGELTLTFGDREHRAVAGTWVQIPIGTPHTLRCTGQGETRFLEIHTPNSRYGDFLRAEVNTGADNALGTDVDLEFV